MIPDQRQNDPLFDMNQDALRNGVAEALQSLNYREREIIRLRYGLSDAVPTRFPRSARYFPSPGKRIRQIECEAMRKLQQPCCTKKLADFVDDLPSKSPPISYDCPASSAPMLPR